MNTTQDQAGELRKMVATPRPGRSSDPVPSGARVIAVTSGKGGVGKSNIAVNLAVQLAAMGRRVALLDADLGLANADLLCGVTPAATLAHVVTGRRTIESLRIKAPGGFTLIPGASGLTQMAALAEHEKARLVALFRRLEAEYDLLIIDTGAGIGPAVTAFLLAADEVLVVTTPEPTSITDAYAMIKSAIRERPEVPISVLVNMARDRREGRAVYERLASVCRRFIGPVPADAGHVPTDPAVTAAVRLRRPFTILTPNSPAGLCLRALAHKMDRQAVEPKTVGFFRRLARGWTGKTHGL